MRLPLRALATIAVALGLVAVPAWAIAAPDHGAGHAARDHHGPRLVPAKVFLPKAAAANRFEIVTGKLAEQQGQSRAVKDLGAIFVRDHSAGLQQVERVAAQLHITLPQVLSPKQQAIVTRLQRLHGKAFDRAWVKAQIHAHKQALVLHLRAAIRGQGDAVRTLAQNALPVITRHLGELLDLAGGSRHHHTAVRS